MRRLLMGMLMAGVLAMTCGCTVVSEAHGFSLKPIPWRLHNGTYRPFNDVNSGGLSPWRGGYRSYGTYEETIERGQLMRY